MLKWRSLLLFIFWKKFYYNQAQYKVAVDGKTVEDSFGYYCNFSLSRRSCFRFHQKRPESSNEVESEIPLKSAQGTFMISIN
jgi:hypothetical protein